MKQLLITLFIVLSTPYTSAQSLPGVQIKGQVRDKETHSWLSSATVACLISSDSSRVALTFTDRNGLFTFNNLQSKDYLIYITFMGYKLLIVPIKIIPNSKTYDLGILEMDKTGLTLAEFEVIEAKSPVRIAKDTLEYSSDYFKTKDNALVEDLFKIVPSIQIDRDGTIRINGEIVKTIMINGRPLFGNDDPKIISRNLQANLIDKIQLIDRKVDQREAFNNGQPDKIINIIIKKTKQNVISGELTAAYGTLERFNTKANISRFNENLHLMFWGNWDNINGALDSKSIGGAGIKQTLNIGMSVSNNINKNTTISASALMNSQKNAFHRSSMKQTIANDSTLFYNQQSDNQINSENKGISMQLEYRIDSMQKITISNQFSLSEKKNRFSSKSETTGSKSQKINSGNTLNIENAENANQSNGLRYEKNFQKKGRSLNLWLSYMNGNGKASGANVSDNLYYQTNSEQLSDTINQKITNSIKSRQLFLMLSYTEPISKDGSIVLSFAEDHSQSGSVKLVYDLNQQTGKNDIMNDSLSNNFVYSPILRITKLGWLLKKEKIDLSVSVVNLLLKMNNRNISLNSTFKKTIIAFLPEANLNYSLGKSRSLRLLYLRSVDFPTISQLQPVPDNSDPLYIRRGNPELKPSDSHNFSISYNSFNITTLHSFSIILNSKLISNQIVEGTWIDSLGRQIAFPLNLPGGYIFDLSVANGIPLKNRKNSVYSNTKAGLRKFSNYLNGIVGYSNNLSLSQSFVLNYAHEELYDFSISSSVGYSDIRYRSQHSTNSKFLNCAISFTGNLNLPLGITINPDINIGWATGRSKGYNANPIIFNASISKLLFSNKQGLIQLQGFDLLKQNTSVTRNIGDNYIEDEKISMLERFFILKFSYFLGKKNN